MGKEVRSIGCKALGLILLLLLCSSCCSIRVKSNPPGARIIIDGRPTGLFTPASVMPIDLPVGPHELTVLKEGFVTCTPPCDFKIQRNTVKGILLTILIPPIGILDGIFTGWKVPIPHQLHMRDGGATFQLEKDVLPKCIVTVPEPNSHKRPRVETHLPNPANSKTKSVKNRLLELDVLRKQGLLTDKEYHTKREDIIDSL